MIAVKWGPGNSRIAVKSIGRVWDQQYSCEVSRKKLWTKRIAVQFPGRVLGPAT